MISESRYWKQDLICWTKYLAKRKKAKRWDDRSIACLEKVLMFGFFVIRRLIESNGRLSTTTINKYFQVVTYPRTQSHFTIINRNSIEKHFDFNKPKIIKLKLNELCNQFIHSYIFIRLLDKREQLIGLLFVSQRYRQHILYELDINAIIKIFRLCGKDDPDFVLSGRIDPKTQDFRFVMSKFSTF